MSPSTGLQSLLEDLSSGRVPPATRLSVLSDLARDDAVALRSAWPAFPLRTRRALLAQAAELAEDDFGLDFAAVGRVALDDDDPSIRALGVEALWESTDRATGERLRSLLETDPSDEVRSAAATALRQFVVLREFEEMDAATGDAIVNSLRHVAEDRAAASGLRARAVEALGPRSLSWVATIITDAYYDDDRALQLAAINAMGGAADPVWLQYVFDQLESDDPVFRFEAAVAAGDIASEDAVEPLVPLLDDEDADVVIATIEALAQISGPLAIERLKEYQVRAPEEFLDLVAEALETAAETAGAREEDDEDG